MKIDITFDEEEIIDILRQNVIDQGFDAGQAKVNITKETIGHQMNEHQECVFNGITITDCTKKKKTRMLHDHLDKLQSTS